MDVIHLAGMSLKKNLLFSSLLFSFFFNPVFSLAYAYTNQECLDCHGKPGIFQITDNGEIRSIFVNPEQWAQDVHNKSKMVCVDCHTYANPFFHFREGFIDVDCSRCHPEEAEEYQKNVHYEYQPVSRAKELPSCYHCHTKHFVIRHDNPSSSVHENNVAETCGSCHPEVMIKGIFEGGSLGKISGHRKGDLSERFDMRICINCHYEDAAHGDKRIYKDFCSRCHNVRSQGGFVIGPTHLDSKRWLWLNYTGSGFVVFTLTCLGIIIAYKSRRRVVKRMKDWLGNMKNIEEVKEKKEADWNQEDKGKTAKS